MAILTLIGLMQVNLLRCSCTAAAVQLPANCVSPEKKTATRTGRRFCYSVVGGVASIASAFFRSVKKPTATGIRMAISEKHSMPYP